MFVGLEYIYNQLSVYVYGLYKLFQIVICVLIVKKQLYF